MKRIITIVKAIWSVFCLCGIILFVEDFYNSFNSFNHSEVYPFGAEGPVAGIWYYKTFEAYLWSAEILAGWFVSSDYFIFPMEISMFLSVRKRL